MAPPASEHFRLEQVGERAWAAIAVESGGAVANAGVVDLGGSALVFDTFFTPAAAADLKAAAEELAGPIAHAVVSHGHTDHYGGAQVFASTPLVATERTRELIAETGPERLESLRAQIPDYLGELEAEGAPEQERAQARVVAAELPQMQITLPTETFDERVALDGAELVTLGGGHTESDAFLWLPDERVLFAGDLVSVESHPNLLHGDPDEWLRILGKLEALAPKRVVPGHGPVGGPEAITAVAGYIRTLKRLAAEEGEPELPEACAGWGFADGFELNVAFLRDRALAR